MIEADLQRHYGVDLTDLWRGTLTLRRVRVLLEHLPPDSATALAVSGDELSDVVTGWRLGDLLLARLVDEVAAYRWEWESAHTERRSDLREQPQSVMPDRPARPEPLRLVSPHSLGSFVNDDDLDLEGR